MIEIDGLYFPDLYCEYNSFEIYIDLVNRNKIDINFITEENERIVKKYNKYLNEKIEIKQVW